MLNNNKNTWWTNQQNWVDAVTTVKNFLMKPPGFHFSVTSCICCSDVKNDDAFSSPEILCVVSKSKCMHLLVGSVCTNDPLHWGFERPISFMRMGFTCLHCKSPPNVKLSTQTLLFFLCAWSSQWDVKKLLRQFSYLFLPHHLAWTRREAPRHRGCW